MSLSRKEKERIVFLYQCGASVKSIAKKLSCSLPTVYKTLKREGIEVPSLTDRRVEYMPSPEKIKEEAAKIRKGWSKEKLEMENVDSPTPWEVPLADNCRHRKGKCLESLL